MGHLRPFFRAKMTMKLTLRQMTFCGILAALYVVLTITPPLNQLSYNAIQFRVSEALCIMPFFAPWTTWGLTIGCLIANIFSTVTALDMVIGTLATLIGCLLTSKIKIRWLAPLPTILSNFLLVGGMLAFVLDEGYPLWKAFLIYGGQVVLGETAVLYLLGIPLLLLLQKTKLDKHLTLIR